MSTELGRSYSLPRNRFGQLSKNMFFARHVAQPRYLKFITGAAGQRICHVREEPLQLPISKLGVITKPIISDPRFNIEFSSNPYQENLLRSYAERVQLKKRRERMLPPISGWNASGMVVEDTSNWRRELARIGEMVGLVTSDELLDIENRKQTPITPVQVPLSSNVKSPITTGQYSIQSGRWNETPKSANRSRSARRRTPLKSLVSDHLYCVDEQEREIWMLQVLCQILQTDSLNEIQSWLVSSGPTEKEAIRQLITKAITGLEENGRIQSNGLSNSNVKGIQVNMDSFGSLLANKFPHVSSLIPSTPPKSLSRPRTAPNLHTQNESSNKSTGSSQTNLPLIDENPEKELSNIESNVVQPTQIDVQRDVQILTLDNDIYSNEQIIHDENEQIPF